MWLRRRPLISTYLAILVDVAYSRKPSPSLAKLEINAHKDVVLVDQSQALWSPRDSDPLSLTGASGDVHTSSMLGILFDPFVTRNFSHQFGPYGVVGTAVRHRHNPNQVHRVSVRMFLQSARALETSGVIVSVALFIWMYGYLIDWHLQKAKHGLLLLTWLGVGMASFTTVHMFYGREESAGWISGYLLELVFSIENVFVFHVIAQSFKAPARLTQKALFCVILGQMIFQAIFFHGPYTLVASKPCAALHIGHVVDVRWFGGCTHAARARVQLERDIRIPHGLALDSRFSRGWKNVWHYAGWHMELYNVVTFDYQLVRR